MGVGVLIILVALLIWSWSPQKTSPFLDDNGVIIESSISSIENININNVDQRLVIRGIDTLNPVILQIHGGPGAPDRALYKATGLNVEDLFTVVYWDQRGSGGSYNKNLDESTLSLQQIVDDGISITEYLKNRFRKEKIYIQGHSWGTSVGVSMAQKRPDLFHAYIGIGQMAHSAISEEISYQYALEEATKAGNDKDVKILESIGPPPYVPEEWIGKMMQQRLVMWKYENPIYPNNQTMFQIYMLYIMHSEYSISDKMGMLKGSELCMDYLWDDAMGINFIDSAKDFSIPVFMIQGKYDKHTVTEVAKVYFDSIAAPMKEYYEFEKAAHAPHFSNYKKYRNIIEEILKKTS